MNLKNQKKELPEDQIALYFGSI